MEIVATLRSFGIGLTCGLRSMTGPAVVSWRAREGARLAFAALAAGELIADKLPATPPRTIPPALIFRALSGGYCGWRVAPARERAPLAGALAGAAGALAGAYGGMALRAALVHWTGLPDPLVALAEDGVAVFGALAATRKSK